MKPSGTQIASPSEWVKKNIIRKLREKKKELGKSPSKGDVDGSLVNAAEKHFGSWNNAKEKAGLETFEFGGRGGKDWSGEKIIDKLRKLADELGRSPVSTDDPKLAQIAHRHFGSWNDAKRAAGLEVFPAPKNRSWSKKKVIDELKELAEELGRAPKVADDHNLTQAARRYFKSWSEAKKAAGVDSLESEENAVPISLGRIDDRKKAFETLLEEVEEVLPIDSLDSIREDATELLCSAGRVSGRPLQESVLGCIYLSCRFNETVVFPDELVEAASSEKTEDGGVVRKSAKVICRRIGISPPEPFAVQKVVERFAQDAGFEKRALEDAVELGEVATDKLNLSGRSRRSLAAAILYIVGCLHPGCNKLTRAEVGSVCEVSGVSIGNNLRFLCETLNREDLPFIPHPPVRRYSGAVREAFVETGDVERSILHKIQELADELGRSPCIKDDECLAQAARERFGSWNRAKKKAGLEVFKEGKGASPPETEKVDEKPEIDEDKPEGLLTSVKRNADVYEHRLSGEKVKRTLGDVAEDLLVSWAKRHKEEVVGDFIYDEDRCRVSYGVPDEHNRCNPRYGIDLEDIRCDLLFLIDQPSTGRSFVMFEAKYGQSGINHEQAQYFRKAHHSPDKIVEDATEGHVMLAKCFGLDIRGEKPHIGFYMGELIVPDNDPLKEE